MWLPVVEGRSLIRSCFAAKRISTRTRFPVYHYLTLDIADHQLHAVMWKLKDPGAGTLSVEQKDEFTIRAGDRPVGNEGKTH